MSERQSSVQGGNSNSHSHESSISSSPSSSPVLMATRPHPNSVHSTNSTSTSGSGSTITPSHSSNHPTPSSSSSQSLSHSHPPPLSSPLRHPIQPEPQSNQNLNLQPQGSPPIGDPNPSPFSSMTSSSYFPPNHQSSLSASSSSSGFNSRLNTNNKNESNASNSQHSHSHSTSTSSSSSPNHSNSHSNSQSHSSHFGSQFGPFPSTNPNHFRPSFQSHSTSPYPSPTPPRLRSNPPSPNNQPVRFTGIGGMSGVAGSINRSQANSTSSFRRSSAPDEDQTAFTPNTNRMGQAIGSANGNGTGTGNHPHSHTSTPSLSLSQHERRDSTVVDLSTDIDPSSHPSSYSHPAHHGALPLRPASRASIKSHNSNVNLPNLNRSGSSNGWRISDESQVPVQSEVGNVIGNGMNRPYSPDAGYGSSSTSASGGGMSLGMAMGGSSSSRAPSSASASGSQLHSLPQVGGGHPSSYSNHQSNGGGGYASSYDGDFVSAPPSRLISRAGTPSFSMRGEFEGLTNIELGEDVDGEMRERGREDDDRGGGKRRRRRNGTGGNESEHSDRRNRSSRSSRDLKGRNGLGLAKGFASLFRFGSNSNEDLRDNDSKFLLKSKSKSRGLKHPVNSASSTTGKSRALSSAWDSPGDENSTGRKRTKWHRTTSSHSVRTRGKLDKDRIVGEDSHSTGGSGSGSASGSFSDGSEDYSESNSSELSNLGSKTSRYPKSSESKFKRSRGSRSSRRSNSNPTQSYYNHLSKSLHPLNPLRIFLPLLRFISFLSSIPTLSLIILLTLTVSFVTSITYLIMYILNPDKEAVPWRNYCSSQPQFPHSYADSLAPIDLFVGVFSTDSAAASERRHLIRNTYAAHTLPLDLNGNPTSNVVVKFILGKPRKANARRIALEKEIWNDLVILDIEENMNRGKTWEFFKWANENASVPINLPKSYSRELRNHYLKDADKGNEIPEMEVGWKKADFVVKADDDAFLVLDELERHLRIAPRELTYWGYLIRNWFMGGECYALSSDLVSYVATSPIVSQYTNGKEDKKVAQWINLHPSRSSINFVSEQCWIYDGPKSGTAYSHGYLFPDEVERIKLEERNGLPEDEIVRRGGEHKRMSYSSVTKWKKKYKPPKEGMTMEEEVEALVEGGGRWKGNDWYRNESGRQESIWLPKEKIVFEAQDERFDNFKKIGKRMAKKESNQDLNTNQDGSIERNSVSSNVEKKPRIVKRTSSISTEKSRRDSAWLGGDRGGEVSTAGVLSKLNIMPILKTLRSHFHLSTFSPIPQPSPQVPTSPINQRSVPQSSNSLSLVPMPVSKEGYPSTGTQSAASIRSRRHLYRPHGGTVVVHFLKKNEWFMETSVALLGNGKTWIDGAGGIASEWRMWGSPRVREDGYVAEGRAHGINHHQRRRRIEDEQRIGQVQEQEHRAGREDGTQDSPNQMLGREIQKEGKREKAKRKIPIPFGSPLDS